MCVVLGYHVWKYVIYYFQIVFIQPKAITTFTSWYVVAVFTVEYYLIYYSVYLRKCEV